MYEMIKTNMHLHSDIYLTPGAHGAANIFYIHSEVILNDVEVRRSLLSWSDRYEMKVQVIFILAALMLEGVWRPQA